MMSTNRSEEEALSCEMLKKLRRWDNKQQNLEVSTVNINIYPVDLNLCEQYTISTLRGFCLELHNKSFHLRVKL